MKSEKHTTILINNLIKLNNEIINDRECRVSSACLGSTISITFNKSNNFFNL